MIEKLIPLLIGVMLAVSGWVLTQTFSLSTNQAVQVDKMMDSDEDIMDQHKRLFKILEKGDTSTGSYNYS